MPAEFQKAIACLPSAPNSSKLLNVSMDECLILREQWCALVRAIPAFRSFLLLFHSSMMPQFQLTTPQPSVILPRAVGTLTRSPRFLLLLILTPNPLMSRAAFLTQTSHFAEVGEWLSLTTSCVGVCCYCLFFPWS